MRQIGEAMRQKRWLAASSLLFVAFCSPDLAFRDRKMRLARRKKSHTESPEGFIYKKEGEKTGNSFHFICNSSPSSEFFWPLNRKFLGLASMSAIKIVIFLCIPVDDRPQNSKRLIILAKILWEKLENFFVWHLWTPWHLLIKFLLFLMNSHLMIVFQVLNSDQIQEAIELSAHQMLEDEGVKEPDEQFYQKVINKNAQRAAAILRGMQTTVNNLVFKWVPLSIFKSWNNVLHLHCFHRIFGRYGRFKQILA